MIEFIFTHRIELISIYLVGVISILWFYVLVFSVKEHRYAIRATYLCSVIEYGRTVTIFKFVSVIIMLAIIWPVTVVSIARNYVLRRNA